jgi:hypothetical protein
MSLSTKPASPSQKRIWKAPTSNARWYWLAASAVLFIVIAILYVYAIKTQQYPGPFDNPLLLFGIISYVLVLATAAYSLRRRFVRGLPGMVQDWLWMHTWLGVISVLIALMHENFAFITNSFVQGVSDLTGYYWAGIALFALIFLVVSGITGRLLDVWQTRIIAHEASSNGVGIVRAVEEHMLEQEYTVERLSAGKSETFKNYCLVAIERGERGLTVPVLPPNELNDFERARTVIGQRVQLSRSHQRQLRAQRVITTWRTIHIVLACLALITILYHGTMELLASVFHLITSA